jgi:hypothetical protein
MPKNTGQVGVFDPGDYMSSPDADRIFPKYLTPFKHRNSRGRSRSRSRHSNKSPRVFKTPDRIGTDTTIEAIELVRKYEDAEQRKLADTTDRKMGEAQNRKKEQARKEQTNRNNPTTKKINKPTTYEEMIKHNPSDAKLRKLGILRDSPRNKTEKKPRTPLPTKQYEPQLASREIGEKFGEEVTLIFRVAIKKLLSTPQDLWKNHRVKIIIPARDKKDTRFDVAIPIMEEELKTIEKPNHPNGRAGDTSQLELFSGKYYYRLENFKEKFETVKIPGNGNNCLYNSMAWWILYYSQNGVNFDRMQDFMKPHLHRKMNNTNDIKILGKAIRDLICGFYRRFDITENDVSIIDPKNKNMSLNLLSWLPINSPSLVEFCDDLHHAYAENTKKSACQEGKFGEDVDAMLIVHLFDINALFVFNLYDRSYASNILNYRCDTPGRPTMCIFNDRKVHFDVLVPKKTAPRELLSLIIDTSHQK